MTGWSKIAGSSGLKLIGAGLPRTGTLTQKVALKHSDWAPATTG